MLERALLRSAHAHEFWKYVMVISPLPSTFVSHSTSEHYLADIEEMHG
jgi:hypothetical protein